MHRLPAHFFSPWMLVVSTVLVTLLLALCMALFGWFYPALTAVLLGAIGLSVIASLTLLVRARSYFHLALIVTITIFACIIATRTEPTVFTGRDQGSIAIAAWQLATQHELAFRSSVSDMFFQFYGPGRALNFPGFTYTETGALITQFPLGYTSYLALFVQWFDIAGYGVANGFLFILSGWSFFELCLRFFRPSLALLGTALFSGSFLIVWLAQMTLTENLALTFFLILSVTLVRAEQDATDTSFLLLLPLTGFLFAMTRIEGFVIAPLALGLVLLRPSLRARLLALPTTWLILGAGILAFILLRDFFMNLPFYTVIAKAALKSWHTLGMLGGAESEPHLGPLLISYGLFPVFVLGIASLILALARRHFALLIPVYIALPTFVYLLNGHISDDHPWLLRRYAFTLWPLFTFLTIALFAAWERLRGGVGKSALTVVGLCLLAMQGVPVYRALATIEYETLRDQVSAFGTQFTEHDLILIDRTSSGDPFTLIAGPLATLSAKNAVYFFNLEDLARIDRQAFDRTYLLTTEDGLIHSASSWENRLRPIEVISFTYPSLAAPTPYAWPVERTVSSDAILFEVITP